MQRMVTVALTAKMHTLRSGEHTRPRYSEDTDSNTAQLDFNTFVQFAIDNGTFGTDNFRSTYTGGAQPPVARARTPVCPSLATPLVEFTHGTGEREWMVQ